MALSDDLISYLSCDEASGNFVDSHAAYDLTDVNGCGAGAGKVNGGRTFNGTDQRATLADNADFSFADIDWSFAGWVKFTAEGGFLFTKDNWDNAQNEYGLSGDATNHRLNWRCYQNRGTEASAVDVHSGTSGPTITTGTWYFFYVEHDSVNNTIGISINAGTLDTAAFTLALGDGSESFVLGCVRPASPFGFFNGMLDEIGFWHRRLSGAELTELYNSGNGRDYNYIIGGEEESSSSQSASSASSPSSSSVIPPPPYVHVRGIMSGGMM